MFTVQRNRITCINGSEFVFYGLARNTEEVKGLEGIDICYIEEAQYITKDMFDLLAPTIRKEGSEIWIAFNPHAYYDFIYQKFVVNPPSNARVRKINYLENPYLSKTLLDDVELYKSDPDFNNVYLGEVKDSSANSIIKLEWLKASIDSFSFLQIERNNKNYLGFDVADDGADLNAYALNLGGELTALAEWHGEENEMDKSVARIVHVAKPHQAVIVYDAIGIGAGVGSFLKLHRLKQECNQFYKFIASGKVENPNSKYQQLGKATQVKNSEAFLNLKAQKWQQFSDKLKITYNAVINGYSYDSRNIISISSEIKQKLLDSLFQELTSPNRELQNEKTMKVESKKSLAKRGIPSHNLADGVIMAFSQKRSVF